MIQMITHYCDYLDTTRLKTNLWEWCGTQASLGDVVYALVSTGDAAILPVIKRYVSFVDADHESFVKEELVPVSTQYLVRITLWYRRLACWLSMTTANGRKTNRSS